MKLSLLDHSKSPRFYAIYISVILPPAPDVFTGLRHALSYSPKLPEVRGSHGPVMWQALEWQYLTLFFQQFKEVALIILLYR